MRATTSYHRKVLSFQCSSEVNLKQTRTTFLQKEHRVSSKQIKNRAASSIFGSVVNEAQRERLARFIKDDFVNDLIFTKYYKIHDEDQKTLALTKLKQQMNDNKAIRSKYNHALLLSPPTFFNHATEVKSEVKELENPIFDGLICKGRTRCHQTFELYSPKDPQSDNFIAKPFTSSQEEISSPKNEKRKYTDYGLNIELLNIVIEEGKKVEIHPEDSPKPVILDYNKFVRIRKSLLEKLFKCVELKITKDEVILELFQL